MGWRRCWWSIWRWCCCGLLPPLLCVFLQLCSPLFPFLPSASHGAVFDWEGNGSWRWCWWRWRGIWRCLTVVMKVAVAGKPDDSSDFLLLLPRAEAQVAAFSSMVQQRVRGRWWAEEGWLWHGQCCCVCAPVGVAAAGCGRSSSSLFCHCFFSLFLSPCFSPNNSLSLSLGFPFFLFFSTPSLCCRSLFFYPSHSAPPPRVFIGKGGEVHHTLYKHRAWWSGHGSSAFRHGGGHGSPVSPLMRVWVV